MFPCYFLWFRELLTFLTKMTDLLLMLSNYSVSKKIHFQRLAWDLSILERFAIFVVCNVTPTQRFENGIFIISELFALDVRQKWKTIAFSLEICQIECCSETAHTQVLKPLHSKNACPLKPMNPNVVFDENHLPTQPCLVASWLRFHSKLGHPQAWR